MRWVVGANGESIGFWGAYIIWEKPGEDCARAHRDGGSKDYGRREGAGKKTKGSVENKRISVIFRRAAEHSTTIPYCRPHTPPPSPASE